MPTRRRRSARGARRGTATGPSSFPRGTVAETLAMRGLVMLVAVAALAGCSSPPPPSPAATQAVFIDPETIMVTTTDILPARHVELTGPLGVVPAERIDAMVTPGPAYGGGGMSSRSEERRVGT